MDAQAYLDAVEQRRALRRAMKSRLTDLREAAAKLGSAAGNGAAAAPTVEITADPIAQIESQVAQATSLAQQIQAHDAKVRTAQRDLETAQEEAKRFVRTAVIIAVVIVLVVVLIIWSH
jgi:hypothetical protein